MMSGNYTFLRFTTGVSSWIVIMGSKEETLHVFTVFTVFLIGAR